MIELFKGSSEEYRSILLHQVDDLTKLETVDASARDNAWQARYDFALSIARDVLKQILPPDSALYGMYAKAISPQTDPSGKITPATVSAYELQLYRLALAHVNWASTTKAAGAFPSTVSIYSEVNRALPEMVYKHPWFKVILATLVALAGLAAFGVFKFYGITVDVRHEIQAKQDALTADFNNQKQDIEAALKTRKRDSDALSEQLAGLGSKLTDAKKQIAQLELEAQGTLARFATQVGRNVDAEVAKAVDKAAGTLAQRQSEAAAKIDHYWTNEAQPTLKKAAEKRVGEILADGWKPFQDKLREFDVHITEATKKMGQLEDRQKTLDGKQMLLSKALDVLANPSPQIVDRLSIYIGEALWVIYGGAGLILVLIFLNGIIIWTICKKS